MSILERKRIDMTAGVIWKQIVQFAIPLFIGNLFQQFYNTVDSIVVGQFVGKAALAAVGTTMPVINTMVGIFTGLSTGATVVLSQFFGAKDKDGIHKTVHTTIALTIICGIVLGAIGFFLANPLLVLMKTPADVFEVESSYLKIYFAGVISLMMYNMGSGILRAVGDSKRPLYFLIICSILNVILDLLFVAVFKMGVAGAAVATIIAQLVSGLLIMRVLMRSNEDIKLILKDIRLDLTVFKKIVKVGIPASIQMSIVSFSNVFVQSYINFFGSDVIAGWSAHMKLESFCMLPVQSISLAATTFVAQNIGADQRERAENGCKTTVLMGIVLQLFIVAVLVLFKETLLHLFTKDPVVIEYGKDFIMHITPFCIFAGITNCFAGAIRGAGDSKTATIILLGSNVVFRQLYLIVSTKFVNTVTSVGLAFPLAWFLGAALMFSYFMTGKWKTKSLMKKDRKD